MNQHNKSTPAFDDNRPGDVAARTDGANVTLSIDGHTVTVPKGTNIIEAAKKLDIAISAFCYHPGLSIAAVCRQCLVHVKDVPKPMPACQMTCTDGMVVRTDDPVIADKRRQMLEFTLVNHPIDCPICDKAGECTLQELYLDHNAKRSRIDVPKVRKRKVVDVGPRIVLDQERCILCTRCIRTCDEVAGTHQLDMAQRGNHEVLTTAPGAALDNDYSLNTVDVCPVGALTQKDFRFTMRAWELMMTPSICTGCATGCNLEIHHREGVAYRIRPRQNARINKFWMCDHGRETHKPLRTQRLAGPLVDGLHSSWKQALELAGQRLQTAFNTDRGRIGVVFSAQHTNEDNFVLARLARECWQVPHVYLAGKAAEPDFGDAILKHADRNPNTRGAQAILNSTYRTELSLLQSASQLEADVLSGTLQTLIILGSAVPLTDTALAVVSKLETVVVLSSHTSPLTTLAQVAFPVGAWAEVHGTLTNHQGFTQRLHAAFPPIGQALPAWEALIKLGHASGATLDYPHTYNVFEDMIATVPHLSDSEWGTEAPIVQLRFANARG